MGKQSQHVIPLKKIYEMKLRVATKNSQIRLQEKKTKRVGTAQEELELCLNDICIFMLAPNTKLQL